MICQGSGGGYGDVLERDPALVMKDLREDLMSHENARDIYKVAYDEETLVVDVEATAEARAAERLARIARGKPFDAFCDAWVTGSRPRRCRTSAAGTTAPRSTRRRWASASGCRRTRFRAPSCSIRRMSASRNWRRSCQTRRRRHKPAQRPRRGGRELPRRTFFPAGRAAVA